MRTDVSPLSSFTLVEILVVVGVIGILSGLAYVNITGLRESSSDTKLRSDVQVINRALDAYRASGGVVPDDAQASEVLLRLKSRSGAGQGLLAFTNAFIDPRTKAIWQSDGEAGASMLRARYANERANTNAPESQTNPKVPRFYVAKDGNAGIKEFIFDETEATNIAVDTNRVPMLARASAGGWVWDYTVTSPSLESAAPSLLPDTVESAVVSTGKSILKLQNPKLNPEGAPFSLGAFTNSGGAVGTMTVYITSPNPPGGWGIYYATAPATALNTNVAPPSFALLTTTNGAIEVPAETQVWAYVASFDPTRFISSDQSTGFYGVKPVVLSMGISAPATVSYPQVTATNPPQAEIRLQPNFDFKYATNGDIQPYYRTGGADPYPGGVAFSNWSNPIYVNLVPDLWAVTNTTAVLKAMAKSVSKPEWFADSPVETKQVGIELTEIPLQILPANPVGLPYRVSISTNGYAPSGYVIYYTSSGVPPLTPAGGGGVRRPDADVMDYSSTPNGFPSPRKTSFTVIAQATRVGQEQWFKSRAEQVYQYIGVNAADLVGMNILGGDVNGVINGNVYLQSSGSIANVNASGRINGNLYVPGLAAIYVPTEVVAKNVLFAYDVSTNSELSVTYTNATNAPLTISKAAIGGAVYNRNGQKIPEEQALDPRQIVDDIGSDVGPPGVKINPGGFVDGKVFRNVDVPDTPDIPVMTPRFPTNAVQTIAPTGTNFLPGVVFGPGVTNMPTNAVPYIVKMTNSNAVLVLGTNTTPLVTNRYFFNPGTWTAGRVEIRGPVEIFFSGDFINEGVQFGTNSTARSTVIYATNGVVQVGKQGDKSLVGLYAIVDVRSNTLSVQANGVFVGGALVKTMNIASGGYVDVSQ